MRRMLSQADMEGKSLYAVCSRGCLERDPFLTGLAAFTAIRRASSMEIIFVVGHLVHRGFLFGPQFRPQQRRVLSDCNVMFITGIHSFCVGHHLLRAN
jgi:hypothetical protein